MARAKASGTSVRELLEEPKKKRAKKRAPAAPAKDEVLDRVLSRVSADPPPPSEKRAVKPHRTAEVSGLRTARLITAAGRAAEIMFRGQRVAVVAAVAEEVEAKVLEQAAKNRDSVLVEVSPDAAPLIVGVIQTRMPRDISLKGARIEIEAEQEVLIRSGRGALRIREDGDVELVGSRVVAMSRGLFRLVGKMLRLN